MNLAGLHETIKARYPTFTGVTRPIDMKLPTQLCWEDGTSKDVMDAAQAIADAWDWTERPEKPQPTEADVDIKLGRLEPTEKQSLIDQMLKEYLLNRPDLMEKF